MTYRATPITQRDGSSLANSNCRMASIATGLDFQTLGARIATASKMRTYTDDQSGGTDSGDARQSWERGYGQALRVMDGATFDDALADLRAGRLVHLDVWHAAVGAASGICLSGSGAYGHTIAVAPERSGSDWLVADPWCSPPKWGWVAESKLRAGAERWGSEVYSRAALEPDYPTGGADPRDPIVLMIVARIVRRLMDAAYPEADVELEPHPPETGGGAILYTTTKAQTGGDDMGVQATPDGPTVAGIYRCMKTAQTIPANGAARGELVSGAVRHAIGPWLLTDLDDRRCYAINEDDELAYVAAVDGTFTPLDPNATDDGDGTDALADRQAQWDADAAYLIGPRPE